MANPYLPTEIPPDADLPEAPEVFRVTPVERTPGFWLPIAIAIALIIGLGYYYHGKTISPSMRAADAMTSSNPSTN